MEKIGIICEYNPFHNGHLYHIEKIKKMYPDSILILVMSGYFTERGDISLLSKKDKVTLALSYGIDIVIELPTIFTLNSADIFSDAAVRLLNQLNVNKIVFGSESNDIDYLAKIAQRQLDDKELDKIVKLELDKGNNYPTALAKALRVNLKSNDILGVSYIKSIIKNGFNIEPISIKRTNDFNDLQSDDKIISANSIREKISRNEDIKKYIPGYGVSLINRIDYNLLFTLLKYKIETVNDLKDYLGVDEGLDNNLKKLIKKVDSVDELISKLNSKRYTRARIKRMLLNVLLGITKNDVELEIENPKILGFSKKGKLLIKKINFDKNVFRNYGRFYEIENRASYIYELLTGISTEQFDSRNKPIIK